LGAPRPPGLAAPLRESAGANLRVGAFAGFKGLARPAGFAAPEAWPAFSESALAALALDGVVLAMRALTLGPPRP
jgi:hypothetical protein